MVISEPR